MRLVKHYFFKKRLTNVTIVVVVAIAAPAPRRLEIGSVVVVVALQDTVRNPKKINFLFWDIRSDLSRSEPLRAAHGDSLSYI
jgi:hypothetical protein